MLKHAFATLTALTLFAATFATEDQPSANPAKSAETKLREKMRSIVFDRVYYDQASVASVFENLHLRSRQVDPTREGVKIILKIDDEGIPPTVTMIINDIPMDQCLQYICAACGLAYAIEGDSVVIRSDPNGKPSPKASKPDHDTVTETPCLEVDAADLRATVVTPVLDAEIPAERNVLWCLTFQLAWNMFKDHLGEPVKMNPMPELARSLNNGRGSTDDIDEDCFVSMAGVNIRGKIEAELKRKFKEAARPELLSDDAIAYAYLFKAMPFKWAFERNSCKFQGKSVACFGIEQLDSEDAGHAKLAKQIHILDYVNNDDFIIELKTRKEDTRLILAKIKPSKTLLHTIRRVQKRISQKSPSALERFECFQVPVINVKIQENYDELCGKPIVCERKEFSGINFTAVIQQTHFRLDENGAVIKSEAAYYWNGSKRNYVFNKPFLVMLQKKGANLPFLALWVANRELLIDAEK